LFAVHNNAPMALSRALVHDMMRQKWGRIVNITTSLGTMIREGSPTYGPSKAALEAFSAIMAKDLAGTGVTLRERFRFSVPLGRCRPARIFERSRS
jgi:short-subunit dehydrogenase